MISLKAILFYGLDKFERKGFLRIEIERRQAQYSQRFREGWGGIVHIKSNASDILMASARAA